MNAIASMLIDMAKFYGYELDKRQLQLYVEVLSGFPESVVLQAGREYVQNVSNTRFPIPPHSILKKHLPAEPLGKDLAIETVTRIEEAIRKFGYMKGSEAAEYVGPVGWSVITRMGWVSICENKFTDALRAQLRDAVTAAMNLGDAGLLWDRPAIDQARERRGLVSFGDALKTATLGPGKTKP